MKRFASIDFLRGSAIVGMLLVHGIGNTIAFKPILNNADDMALINLVALVAIPYLGGLAGFFLLVSAIGNMVSMHKRLQAGKPVKNLVIEQVVGGILLLAFAHLCESTTGYYGALGDFFRNLHRPAHPDYLAKILARGFTVETIHTIAWCVLINGVVQGILSRNGAWKNVRYQVTAYTFLAVVVVAVTQPVWQLVQRYGGSNGYPFDLTTGESVYLPNILIPTTTVLDVLKGVFLNPLAAPLEPLFPYLSISFVGSIIAIVISQPPENIPRHFPKTMVLIGSLMFIVGAAGVIWFLITTATGPGGFDQAADALRLIPFHRHWYNYPKIPATFTFPFAWLWQFLSLNGLAIMLVMLLIRAVEFRGRGASFAEKTTFIRRFGFIAFTNYNNQWCIWLMQYAFGAIIAATGAQLLAYPSYMPGAPFNPYQRLDWEFTLLLVAAVFAVYHGAMRLWEKVGYIGSLEWCILTIVYAIVPGKKTGRHGETRKSWWQKGKLNVCNAFYNPEWLDIVRREEVDHANNVDSKLACKVALAGLASIIFMPVTFITLAVAIEARKTEGRNRHNSIAKAISVIGICVTVSLLISLFFVTPRMVGLPL